MNCCWISNSTFHSIFICEHGWVKLIPACNLASKNGNAPPPMVETESVSKSGYRHFCSSCRVIQGPNCLPGQRIGYPVIWPKIRLELQWSQTLELGECRKWKCIAHSLVARGAAAPAKIDRSRFFLIFFIIRYDEREIDFALPLETVTGCSSMSKCGFLCANICTMHVAKSATVVSANCFSNCAESE